MTNQAVFTQRKFTFEVKIPCMDHVYPKPKKKYLYYIDAPGQPGYYGTMLHRNEYFEDYKVAETVARMLKIAYERGMQDKATQIKNQAHTLFHSLSI